MGFLSNIPPQNVWSARSLAEALGAPRPHNVSSTLLGLADALGSRPAPAPAPARQWIHVSNRFRSFLANIEPTDLQHQDVYKKIQGITACLTQRYWAGILTANDVVAIPVGSWGKGTRVRTVSDLDLIFLLPWEVLRRYETRQGNKQSQILQEIKEVLAITYPDTDIRSDGPTVIMDFTTYKVEIAPAFLDFSSTRQVNDPAFLVNLCDTNNNGRYKPSKPIAEHAHISRLNQYCNGNVVALIRMAKIWKKNCNVPIKSFLLEHLAIEFLEQWPHAREGIFWYDWMIRDFFAFMLTRRDKYAVTVSTHLE